jgi:hypothetical protein
MTGKVSVDGFIYNLIIGTSDADILNGTSDARSGNPAGPIGDIIIGLEGDDTIAHSKAGSDIFVFRFAIHVDAPAPFPSGESSGATEVVVGVDGHDRILDFDVNSDRLALEGIRDAASFKEHFDVVKDSGYDHTLTIETADNDTWSVQLKLVGLDHAGGPAWNSMVSGSDAFEQWAWDTLVAHAYDGPYA